MTSHAQLLEPTQVDLKDGSRVVVRPIRPDDAARLQAFHTRLSPQTIYLRWLAAHPVLTPAEAQDLANLDYDARMAFVAVCADTGQEEIVGVARYGRVAGRPEAAETAVVVEDAYQSRGLGTHLMRRLLAYARARGVRTLVAEINAENARMMKFIRRAGLPVTQHFESGSWQVSMDISGFEG